MAKKKSETGYLDPSWPKYDPILDLVETPIIAANILNGGGVSMNSIMEAWGNSMSGKSTTWYQTAGMFLKQYGKRARVLIGDVEASANVLRLSKVFDIGIGFLENEEGEVQEADPDVFDHIDERVTLCRAATVEGLCGRIRTHMARAKREGTFLLVIWDSLTASVPKTEAEEYARAAAEEDEAAAFKGGMMLKPRIIRQQLNAIMADMWFTPVLILIINQASTKITRFGSSEHSTGGYALKHNAHYRVHFDQQKTEKSDDGKVLFTHSTVEFEKSKYSPRVADVGIYIKDTAGGKVSPKDEAAWGLYHRGFFNAASGNYKIKEDMRKMFPEGFESELFEKSRKWKAIIEDADGEVERCYRVFLEHDYRSTFSLLDEMYRHKEERQKKRDAWLAANAA